MADREYEENIQNISSSKKWLAFMPGLENNNIVKSTFYKTNFNSASFKKIFSLRYHKYSRACIFAAMFSIFFC